MSEWSTARLGPLCVKVGSGATPRGGKESYKESGISLIRSQNVYNNRFEVAGLAFIDEVQAAGLSNVEVEPEDVLLNITGDSVARACQVPETVLPARVNQHVAIVRPDPDRLDPGFLRYWLVSPRTQAHMLALASAGATRKALTKGMIEDFEVPLPEIETQRSIAHILGTLDDKIELNRRMNRTLEAIARAIFKSWFIDFLPVRAKITARTQTGDPVHAKAEGREPIGMDPETVALFPDSFQDSPLGRIPKGWKVGTLSMQIEVLGGGTPKTTVDEFWNGDIPWFSVVDAPDSSDVWVVDTQRHITSVGLGNCSASLFPVRTTILSARGTVGKCGLTAVPMTSNQSCYGIRGEGDRGDFYTYYLIRQHVADLEQHGHGSVFTTITRATFRGIQVIIPPTRLTAAFDRKVEEWLIAIQRQLQEARVLAGIRETLLPKLLSGEIDVASEEGVL